MKRMIQQGDVLLQAVAEIPEGAKALSRDGRGRLILAEGEATGHAHAVLDQEAELVETMNKDMYLRCMSACTLVHEEHKEIVLEPGIYKIGRVKEFDYLSMMARNVED